MTGEKKYLYGPVPSRRLGRSLGVDIVPFKVCTLDCIYCQLGKTTEKTVERKPYVSADLIEAELSDLIKNGLQADYITIAGAGEPTLNSQLGEIIGRIKKITNIPVAVVTNGTLLYRQDVRTDCAKADVVLPSLDAGDEKTFRKINRPHRDINIEKHVSGMCSFREEYKGQIWFEVFVVEPVNNSVEQISNIKTIIERIRPDKVQLNTAVRPTAEIGVVKLNDEKLKAIAEMLGHGCEVITGFNNSGDMSISEQSRELSIKHPQAEQKIQTLFSMLKRRPCSLNDISFVMNIEPNEAIKYVTELKERGLIASQIKNDLVFYIAI